MRFALLLLLVLAQEAHADVAWPKRLNGLYIGGGAGFVGNESIGGPAITTDYARGLGRFMLGGELSGRWLVTNGVDVRAGGLVRWLARSFRPDSSAAIELYVDGSPGVQVIAANGARVARPDVRLGGGLQVRDVGPVSIRIALRVTFAPPLSQEDVAAIACRGQCMSTVPAPQIDDGFEVLVGIAW